jgi:SdpI/YfhL protein family
MHHDQLRVASSLLIVGLVTLCVSLPLLYRKVRMNRFYGIRIAQAFVSEERWYEINEYGGRLLARCSWPIILSGIIGFFVPSSLFLGYLAVALGILFVCVFTPLFKTIRWARSSRDTQRTVES